MKNRHAANLGRAAVILALATASPIVLGQRIPEAIFNQDTFLSAQRQEQLQQIQSDKSGYAAAIVRRWEDSARASGRWNENYSVELQGALMGLQPANLLAAGEASSYDAMRSVLATGRANRSATTREPLALGSLLVDQVFTPLTPCRMVDTRFATPAGPLASLSTHTYDADGSNFSPQGGSATGCGVPFGAATAIAATITIVNTSASGFLAAFGLGVIPNASVINWDHANATLANTTVIPIVNGGGDDFSIYCFGTTNVIVDVLGYFAPPVATALDCTTVASAMTAMPVNSWNPSLDVNCPAGFSATGGGWLSAEGTLGYPGVWILSVPNGSNGWSTFVDNQTSGTRTIQTWCKCCRIPGR